MTNPLRSWLLAAALPLAACSPSDDATPSRDAGTASPPASQPSSAAAVVYDVKCGCVLDGIHKCGNYIRVDGKFVKFEHPSLGAMEFCRQKEAGARVEAVGTMQDGTFVAESWKQVE